MPSMTGGDADCRLCEDDQRAAGTIDPLFSSFIICGDCGNKRCPRATYHGHACTRSNRPRQTGSNYGDVRCGAPDCRCIPAHAEAVAMRREFEDVIRDASRVRAGATRELFDLLG